MFKKLREKFLFERENMNPIRFRFNYLYSLSIFGVMILSLLACLLLLAYGGGKNLVSIVATLVVFVLCWVLYVVLSFLVRKREIEEESESLKYFFSAELIRNPECEYILPRAEENSFVELNFTKDGIKIDKLKYSYEGFECSLFTSNFLRHVNLVIVFTRTEQGDKEDGEEQGVTQFTLPLNLNLLSIMNKFNISLKNPDVLRFIKDNPEIASKQILKYGKIQDDYDKIEEKIKEKEGLEEGKKEEPKEDSKEEIKKDSEKTTENKE